MRQLTKMSRLERLTPEVLANIGQQLVEGGDKHTMRNLCSTSRPLKSVTQRYLYHTIQIRLVEQLLYFCRTVMSLPHLGEFVKILVLDVDETIPTWFSSQARRFLRKLYPHQVYLPATSISAIIK